MKQVPPIDILESRILELELLKEEQLAEIRNSSRQLVSSISPGQVLKRAVGEFMSSKDVRSNALKAAVGIGAGLLTDKLVRRQSGGSLGKRLVKRLAASALLFAIPAVVRKISGLRSN